VILVNSVDKGEHHVGKLPMKSRLTERFSKFYDDCITKEKSKQRNIKITETSISSTGKIVTLILSKRLESEKVGVTEEDQFGFRKSKGIRDFIGLTRIIS
jgi:hypothetical protein